VSILVDFSKNFYNCGKIGKKCQKQAKNATNKHIIVHTLAQKPKIVEMPKVAQTQPMV